MDCRADYFVVPNSNYAQRDRKSNKKEGINASRQTRKKKKKERERKKKERTSAVRRRNLEATTLSLP